jgi:GTPase SAR1 family protein
MPLTRAFAVGFVRLWLSGCLWEQWVPEVRHFCPNTPFVLVGCKRDLRNDPTTIRELQKMNQKPVSEQEVCTGKMNMSERGPTLTDVAV